MRITIEKKHKKIANKRSEKFLFVCVCMFERKSEQRMGGVVKMENNKRFLCVVCAGAIISEQWH